MRRGDRHHIPLLVNLIRVETGNRKYSGQTVSRVCALKCRVLNINFQLNSTQDRSRWQSTVGSGIESINERIFK